jgi:putative peptidoglycan lipid II flippase
MTWNDRPWEPYDLANEATVLLPVVPVASESTMVLPETFGYDPDRTQLLPAISVPPAPEVVAAVADEQPSVARSSAIMAAGSLVSRITGLLRTVMIGAAIGASVVGNSYNLSNNLPNMVYELLLGGVLGSVLVPYLTRARLSDADRGQAYAQRLMTLTLTFLAGATVIAVAAAPLLTHLFSITQKHPTPTSAQLHLTTTLSYLILPEILFYGFAALAAAILNTRGHFAAPTWTPILNNIVVIATAGLFIALPGVKHPDTGTITTTQILVLGVGTTLGIVVQAAGLLPALRKVGYRWKLRFDWRELQLRELGRASGWMLSYVVASEIALVVGLVIMTGVGSHKFTDGTTAPGVAIYSSAYLVFVMAHGICAVSIMVALMPRLSAAAAEGRLADLARQIASGTRLSSVILIPITAAYFTLGHPLAITLFSWHSYTPQQAHQTGTVIALAGLGLVPYAISQMQLFAFYALREQKTAGLISFPTAAARIALDVLFAVVLPIAVVTASLMVANTISYLLAMIIGYVLLRRKLGNLGLQEMFTALGRLALAAVVAAIPTYLLVLAMQHAVGTGKLASVATLIAGGIVLVAVYIGVAIALKAKDVTDVAAMVRSRLGR